MRVLFTRDGRTGYARRLEEISLADLVFCHPTRDFSRRHGQINKPVAFFSRTVGDLVACESQHERRFLILADWNLDVIHIAAQPFTIEFPTGHELKSHTPDFVLITRNGGVVVVDVKRPSAVGSEEVLQRHAAVHQFLAQAGMQHASWSDIPHSITSNLALFASARAPEAALAQIGPEVLEAARSGARVHEVVSHVADLLQVPAPLVLVVVRRLLWNHKLAIDLRQPFGMETTLL
ncbi:TnsA-like heteromeric transposase endonuclease subunit [Leifsonia sp. NPDC014704]|uniref:TnsA-like heteromeric transposase endonuclease subunit n=1 Tax=Leifsonia sp. NPDC014704 TaxID=3364123 RepID=UPI0036F4A237